MKSIVFILIILAVGCYDIVESDYYMGIHEKLNMTGIQLNSTNLDSNVEKLTRINEMINFTLPKVELFTNQLHKGDAEVLRQLDSGFLKPNITEPETLVSKYLSTKYLFWKEGVNGKNIKLGIFDSGVNNTHLGCNVADVINYTDETNDDSEGHGTFISSVIYSLI
jgi:subtilisin family serine protease